LGGVRQLSSGDNIKLGSDVLFEFFAQPLPAQNRWRLSHPAYRDTLDRQLTAIQPPDHVFDEKSAPYAADPAAQTRLVVTIGRRASPNLPLTKPQISIGARRKMNIVIDSEIVSRHHARLEKIANQYRLVILPVPLNETHLSGRLISQSIDLQAQRHHSHRQPESRFDGDADLSGSGRIYPKAAQYHVWNKIQTPNRRDAENDVVLDAPMISRYHAKLSGLDSVTGSRTCAARMECMSTTSVLKGSVAEAGRRCALLAHIDF